MSGGKKTITNTENKIGALRIQSSSQGLPIPIVFGKTRIASNMLWYGDFTAVPHTETQESGGKGGGGVETVNTTYTYTVGVILGWAEGPSVVSNFLGTVWSGKTVTDATALGLSQFTGSYSQTPWAYLTTNHPTEARAMRGQMYSAHAALDLGSSDGIPNLTAEVTGLLDDADVNLADVLEEMLTSDKFGAGWPLAQLDSLDDFRDYCAAAGFLASPAYTAQRPMADIVTELCLMGNSAPVWSEGLLKIIPYADETVGAYTPTLTVCANLTYDDFLASPGEPPVKITRKRQADAFNQVQVEVLDRANQYNANVTEAKDQWNIDVYGLRPMEPIEAHAICDANVGRSVAQTILQRKLYIRNTYEFTIGWRYARLEPMDIVTINDPLNALDELAVRLTGIEENENGELACTAEDVNIGVSTPGVYATPATAGSTPAGGLDAGDTYEPVIFQPPLALSGSPQVWLGAQGGLNWGGAQVWVSTDGGSSYARVGEITQGARYGELTATLPTSADPDTTHTLAVDLSISRGTLTDATQSSADALVTMSYCDGEIVSYSNATLTAPYCYDLDTYLRRAQSGSTVGAHLSGTKFMRLDEAVQHFNVSTALYGTLLYIKLPSYNLTGGGLQDLADATPWPFLLVAQVQTGDGFAFIADRTTTTVGDPGFGKFRFNNAVTANASVVTFDDHTADGANMVAYFACVGNIGFMELRDYYDPTKWATFTINGASSPSGYQTFNAVYKAGGTEIPNGDTVMLSISPQPQPGVTSVGLVLPASTFTVSNSPVTTTGNLTASLVSQANARFFAGPLTGNAATPTWRALAATDFNGGANASNTTVLFGNMGWGTPTAGIGSVALTVPSVLSVANSPLTANGTLALTLTTQNAATFLAGPATGNAVAPTFRAIAATDFNAGTNASNTSVLFGDMTWGNMPVVFALYFGATAIASEQVFKHSFRRAAKLVASLTGSKFIIDTNPTATMTWTIAKNGSSVGTVAFSTSGVPTVTFSSDVTFAVDDTIAVTAPGTADATGADVTFSLKFALV